MLNGRVGRTQEVFILFFHWTGPLSSAVHTVVLFVVDSVYLVCVEGKIGRVLEETDWTLGIIEQQSSS